MPPSRREPSPAATGASSPPGGEALPCLSYLQINQPIKGANMTTTTSTSNQSLQELRELPLDAIEPDPSQPRRFFDEAALQELAGSIGERGVLQPVLVRHSSHGKYELIAGERRWRAAKIASLQSIPA